MSQILQWHPAFQAACRLSCLRRWISWKRSGLKESEGLDRRKK